MTVSGGGGRAPSKIALTTMLDDFKSLGLVVTNTCTVCTKRCVGEIPLEEFDFDETCEDVAVKLSSVFACSACWRTCLSDLATEMRVLPTDEQVLVFTSNIRMEKLMDQVVRQARKRRLEGE